MCSLILLFSNLISNSVLYTCYYICIWHITLNPPASHLLINVVHILFDARAFLFCVHSCPHLFLFDFILIWNSFFLKGPWTPQKCMLKNNCTYKHLSGHLIWSFHQIQSTSSSITGRLRILPLSLLPIPLYWNKLLSIWGLLLIYISFWVLNLKSSIMHEELMLGGIWTRNSILLSFNLYLLRSNIFVFDVQSQCCHI